MAVRLTVLYAALTIDTFVRSMCLCTRLQRSKQLIPSVGSSTNYTCTVAPSLYLHKLILYPVQSAKLYYFDNSGWLTPDTTTVRVALLPPLMATVRLRRPAVAHACDKHLCSCAVSLQQCHSLQKSTCSFNKQEKAPSKTRMAGQRTALGRLLFDKYQQRTAKPNREACSQ